MKLSVNAAAALLAVGLIQSCGQAEFFGDTDRLPGRRHPTQPAPEQQAEPKPPKPVTNPPDRPGLNDDDDDDGPQQRPDEQCTPVDKPAHAQQQAPIQAQMPIPECDAGVEVP